jgi:peptidylprolyl isomerase
VSKKKSQSKSVYLKKYQDAVSRLQQRFPQWKILALGILAIIGIVVILTVVLWPSNEATTARNGDTVKVAYIGTYDDGIEFDSANVSAPLEFTIGDGTMIPGFDKGVIGMSVNEIRKIRVKPEEGYGVKEYVADISLFPPNVAAGQYYSGSLAGGLYIENARVTNVSESKVTLENLNPMAGLRLNFEITLVELIKAE